MRWNRRNFIGSMLAIGAGFSILPPLESGSRIWKAERKVIVEEREVGSIWNDYSLSWGTIVPNLPPVKTPGEIRKCGRGMYYGTYFGWVALSEMDRPLGWKASNLYTPTNNLGSSNGCISHNSCWEHPGEDPTPFMPLDEEPIDIPNLNGYMQADGSIKFERVA